ncbi:MAG: deoxynucleoside kinase [Anaerolineae bacterium]|nr:deoxynucleoside kinase [Anaerolineae bacterium]
MNEPKRFIAVAGNIGAGKSTLTRMLANAFGWQPFFEANTENPYLADFYADMQRWSFHSQVFFLGKRLEHHHQLLEHPNTAVQDRTVYEDAEIFASNLYHQGHMSQRDYEAYCNIYHAVSAFLPPPDLIIYLQASVDTLVQHIQRRGREYERQISPQYLDQLNQLYEHWINGWSISPVLRVDMDQLDLFDSQHFEQIKAEVNATLLVKSV